MEADATDTASQLSSARIKATRFRPTTSFETARAASGYGLTTAVRPPRRNRPHRTAGGQTVRNHASTETSVIRSASRPTVTTPER